MDTVATDTTATTGLMAITVAGTGRRRGPLMPSLLLMLWLTPLLMLMPGTATMATAVLTDTATDGTGRGQQMLSQSPLLPLSPMLMLMPGTATTATDMGTTATDTDTATTAHTNMPTGAKQANREVDSSSDCDFPSTLASISRACA